MLFKPHIHHEDYLVALHTYSDAYQCLSDCFIGARRPFQSMAPIDRHDISDDDSPSININDDNNSNLSL